MDPDQSVRQHAQSEGTLVQLTELPLAGHGAVALGSLIDADATVERCCLQGEAGEVTGEGRGWAAVDGRRWWD